MKPSISIDRLAYVSGDVLLAMAKESKPCATCEKQMKRGFRSLSDWNKTQTCGGTCASLLAKQTIKKGKDK
jgi:hypothetical protein